MYPSLPLSYDSPIELPSNESLKQLIIGANPLYDEVYLILSAGNLSPLLPILDEFIIKNKGRANYHLIDSETLSAGQGFLVNKTIKLIQNNIPPQKIEEEIRKAVPQIYTLLCSPNLSFLHSNGFLDAGQLITGEQHSIYPLFSLENGQINSLDKLKNLHGVSEYLIEFLEEYEAINQLVFIHPRKTLLSQFEEIKQYASENLAIASYSDISANSFLSNLIGPEGFGIILIA